MPKTKERAPIGGPRRGPVTVPTRSWRRTYDRFGTFPRDVREEKKEGYAGVTLGYTLADHVKS